MRKEIPPTHGLNKNPADSENLTEEWIRLPFQGMTHFVPMMGDILAMQVAYQKELKRFI